MVSKSKELKHIWVFDQNGSLVNANDVTPQDKINNRYYITGFNELGEEVMERVVHVSGDKKRKHFRRYSIKTTKTADGEQINRVMDTSRHGETVLHILAKRLFKDGKIAWIELPKSILKTPTQATFTKDKGVFIIQSCEIERKYEVPELGKHVIFDILAYNKISNRKLGIEIYVNHRSSSSKIEKLRYINFDVIEIDISSLNNPDSLADENLENNLINIITKSTNTIYLRECLLDGMREALNRIEVIDELRPTRLEGDGRFLFYKDQFCDKLPNCQLIATWDGNTEAGNRDRDITELQCCECRRYIGTAIRTDGKEVMFCNQSNIDRQNIINTLFSMLKLG